MVGGHHAEGRRAGMNEMRDVIFVSRGMTLQMGAQLSGK